MADEGRAMPKALMTTVRRFSGQRRRVRLTLSSGSTTAGANDILRIRMPQNSLVDMASFSVTGTLAVSANHHIQGTHTMVRRVGVVASGLSLNYQNNQWGLLAHASDVAGQGLEWSNSNAVAGCNPDAFAGNTDVVALNYWPHTPLNAGCLDTGLTGEVEVDIAFAGPEASIPDTGVTAAGTFSLSGIKAYVDVIDLEDDTYRKGVAAMLQGGKTYEKSMDLATCVIQDATGSNNFNVSTGCLNKVMVVPKNSAYLTRAPKEAEEVYSNYLNGSALATSKLYVQIGSQSFPQYGFGDSLMELADSTRYAEGGASSYNFNKLFLARSPATGNPLITNAAVFATDNAFISFQVGAFRAEQGKEHGIDISSGNSVIRVESEGLPANSKLLMAGCHTSKLICKAGQVVAFKA